MTVQYTLMLMDQSTLLDNDVSMLCSLTRQRNISEGTILVVGGSETAASQKILDRWSAAMIIRCLAEEVYMSFNLSLSCLHAQRVTIAAGV